MAGASSWDVVIVGAGTAGCVVAARLSQDPARQVLLLEAGPDRGESTGDAGARHPAERFDWGLSATITGNRAGALARGRVVGGSAQVNDCGALRALPADFTEWANAGLPGWSWPQVLRSYCRLETDQDYGDQPYHGTDGPVPIHRPRSGDLTPMAAFLEAAMAHGHPYVEDMNAPDAVGIGPYPHNQWGTTPASTAATHLQPARGRRNLTVRADCVVDRVLVENDRAVGVLVGGERIAADQVILCCGAPQTPALLLRSGIGHAEQLHEVGVDPLVHLPGVGRGLYDQPGAVIPAIPAPGMVTSSSPLTQVIARLNAIPGHRADQGYYLALFTGPPPGGGEPVAAVMVGDLNRRSRGRVDLSPGDLSTRVDLNFYGADGDLDRMRDAYRHAWDITRHPSFTRIVNGVAEVDDAVVADPDRLDQRSLGITGVRQPVRRRAR